MIKLLMVFSVFLVISGCAATPPYLPERISLNPRLASKIRSPEIACVVVGNAPVVMYDRVQNDSFVSGGGAAGIFLNALTSSLAAGRNERVVSSAQSRADAIKGAADGLDVNARFGAALKNALAISPQLSSAAIVNVERGDAYRDHMLSTSSDAVLVINEWQNFSTPMTQYFFRINVELLAYSDELMKEQSELYPEFSRYADSSQPKYWKGTSFYKASFIYWLDTDGAGTESPDEATKLWVANSGEKIKWVMNDAVTSLAEAVAADISRPFISANQPFPDSFSTMHNGQEIEWSHFQSEGAYVRRIHLDISKELPVSAQTSNVKTATGS